MEKRLDFPDYQQAMSYAKEYAKKTFKTTKIIRNGDQWSVLYKENTEIKPHVSHASLQVTDYFFQDDIDARGERYCGVCDTPIGSSGECYNCEID